MPKGNLIVHLSDMAGERVKGRVDIDLKRVQGAPGAGGENMVASVAGPADVLTVTGMTWRFGPDAKLIIRPGGYARFINSTLTSYGCDYARWPGVRVEGNTDARQTTYYQGKLYLGGSTVSNARIGVRCAKELPGAVDDYGYTGPVDANGYGGILTITVSTFRNCLTGADLGEYHHSPTEDPDNDDNASQFISTRFTTEFTPEWPLPDQLVPRNHLYIHGTRKVNVTNCSFANDSPMFFPVEQWGTGIKVDAAEITVQGYTNPASSYVRNLSTGIDRMNCTKLPITVDGMRFSGNLKGVWDHACYLGRYTNNTFSVPDQGTEPSRREGIRLDQSRYFTVERNAFTGADQAIESDENSIGIFFLGIAPVPNGIWNYSAERIYDNTFTDLYAGTLVNNVHVSHDGMKDTEGLQILCGDYVNNVMDIALGPVSPIRSDQGTPINDPNQRLAGNTFDHTLNPVDCGGIYDWDMDIDWNDIDPLTAMIIDYHRHDDPVCAVVCDSQEGSNPDLADANVGNGILFNKAGDCGYGVLDNSHMMGDVHNAYTEARALGIAARDLLEGITNGGERPDLLADLAQSNPWLGSSYLRDELILHSPLSDEVLDSMIVRVQPMDAWHITQVMVENSPLNPGVYSLLKTSDLLSTFFMNVVLDAQNGQGPSAKQLLEQELIARRNEQAEALALLGWMWGTDTTVSWGVDSLRALFFQQGALDFTQARIELLISEGDFAGAADQMDELRPNYSGYTELQDLLAMGTAHNGAWSQLSTTEKDSLRIYAERKVQGAGLITGILMANGFPLPLVVPIFPRHTRALQEAAVEPVRDSRLVALMAYPDPADEIARITFPAELKGHSLEVIDAQGRVALSMPLTTFGLAELRTAPLSSGAYQLRIKDTTSTGRLLVKH